MVATGCSPEIAEQAVDETVAAPTTSSTPDTATPATTNSEPLPSFVDPVAAPDPGASFTAAPFAFGVASGDPTTDGVVLWTALSADGAEKATVDVACAWDLALDESFTQVIRSELDVIAAADGHTIRAVVSGLAPATRYWFRFRVGTHISTIGRTVTLPTGLASSFTMAVSSCQARDDLDRWDAHAVLADDDSVDMVLWLGDFIYEQGASQLQQYRDRYREARTDQRLQRSSGAHPWFITWDDHEVVNDYDSDVNRDRRAAAYQAWWEFAPTRLPRPGVDGLKVYRSVDVADLARIVLLDCRQYATSSSVLGAEQLAWLAEAVQHPARRTIVASPVLMSSIGLGEMTPAYAFEAVPNEQQALREMLSSAPETTIVSGDLHASMELQFTDAITEVMAPPLSSSFPPDLAAALPFLPLLSEDVVRAEVAHGYLRLAITPETVEAVIVG